MEKYIVFEWSPTGSCWMTYIKPFEILNEARAYAQENNGVIIKTDFFEDHQK